MINWQLLKWSRNSRNWIRNHSRWRTVYLCFFISFSKALTSECRTLRSVSIMNSPFLSDASFKCLSLCKRLRKIRVEGKLNEFVLFFENVFLSISGVQGWRSGESIRLPPMWPGFDSQIRRQMWVEFVGSLLCTERLSPGTPDSPTLKNQTSVSYTHLTLPTKLEV